MVHNFRPIQPKARPLSYLFAKIDAFSENNHGVIERRFWFIVSECEAHIGRLQKVCTKRSFLWGQIKRKDGDQANRDGMQLFPQLNCQNTSRCELSANTSLFPPHPPPSTPWKISKASLRFIPECFGLSEDLAQTCLGKGNTLCYTGWGV